MVLLKFTRNCVGDDIKQGKEISMYHSIINYPFLILRIVPLIFAAFLKYKGVLVRLLG